MTYSPTTPFAVLMWQFDLHLFIGRGECLEDEFNHVFAIAPNLLWCSLVERHVTTRRENQDWRSYYRLAFIIPPQDANSRWFVG